jgi:hypothetical protein
MLLITQRQYNHLAFSGQALLTLLNLTLKLFNGNIFSCMPGDLHFLHSVDTADIHEHEYYVHIILAKPIQNQNLPNLKPWKLKLGHSKQVLLLQNMNLKDCFCIRMLLTITQMGFDALKNHDKLWS